MTEDQIMSIATFIDRPVVVVNAQAVKLATKWDLSVEEVNSIRFQISQAATVVPLSAQLGVAVEKVDAIYKHDWYQRKREVRKAQDAERKALRKADGGTAIRNPRRTKARNRNLPQSNLNGLPVTEIQLRLGSKESAATIAERYGLDIERVHEVRESVGVPRGSELERLRTSKAKQELADARKEADTLRGKLAKLEANADHLSVYVVDQDNITTVLTAAAEFLGVHYVLKSKEIPQNIVRAVETLRRRALPLQVRKANDEANRSETYNAARLDILTDN